jgi:IS30 family transposase
MYYFKRKSAGEIAPVIGVHKATVYREIKRNSGVRGYHHKLAQANSDSRNLRLRNYRALSVELRVHIRARMTGDQLSPEQIKGELETDHKFCVCVETTYAYIRADRKNGGGLWKHCRLALKHVRRPVRATAP